MKESPSIFFIVFSLDLRVPCRKYILIPASVKFLLSCRVSSSAWIPFKIEAFIIPLDEVGVGGAVLLVLLGLEADVIFVSGACIFYVL